MKKYIATFLLVLCALPVLAEQPSKEDIQTLTEAIKDFDIYQGVDDSTAQALHNIASESGLKEMTSAIIKNAEVVPELMRDASRQRHSNSREITALKADWRIHDQKIDLLDEARVEQRGFNKKLMSTVDTLGNNFEDIGNVIASKFKEYDWYIKVFWALIGIIPFIISNRRKIIELAIGKKTDKQQAKGE